MERIDEKSLHGLFLQRALENPQSIALRCDTKTVTYAELDKASDYYAGKLIESGIGANDFVALCFDRNNDMIVGILSILKAGATYVPVDPAYPRERRNFLLEDSGAKVLLCAPTNVHLFNLEGTSVILLDTAADTDKIAKTEKKTVESGENAYMIYTSGTTGKPKGVLVTHQNVLRLFEQTDPIFGFNKSDKWSLFHSVCFDFSVWEIWGALLYGAELVVVPYAVTRSPERFYQLVHDQKITVLNQTPSAFRNFVQVDQQVENNSSAIRYIIFGGEKLEYDLVNEWVELHGDAAPQLINMYGITETTVHVTYKRIFREEIRAGEACPIGLPIPDLTIHLLDEAGAPVAVGSPGEMYVSGAGVAVGYHNRPELNAERFVTKVIKGENLKMYRSGDLAYKDERGQYYYIGRSDDQIKLNGFRIEPRELESISKENEEVTDSVILKADFGPGDERLINFVLTRRALSEKEGQSLINRLSDAYRNRVPVHMVPFTHVLWETYPKTMNGKLDKKWMIQQVLDKQKAASHTKKAGSVSEQSLAIWEEVLQKQVLNSRADFFDIGGTSLQLIQLMQQTKQNFGVQLNMGGFVSGLTLEAYSAEVARGLAKNIWKSILKLEELPEKQDFFDLGGTSLQLIQLIQQTKEILAIKLEMKEFIEGLTFELFTKTIEKHVSTQVQLNNE
ncbi:amino acid adenylation domain-containing protein [Fluviicola sp.]|uniref:amino acid adenylation domain-containing protein n=1 Tax=Fluviicola sp. TaxID=1917219 RepID=UPI002612B649|nr:amino acid adenylation domain-containing protein [Fluviicola sp.]